MNRAVLFVSALILTWTSAANAHGPSRQKVSESIVINASADAVWAKIKNFHDASWMPMVAGTAGQGGNDAGATRELTLKAGGVVKEELKKYDDAEKSFSYKIVKDGVDMKVLPVNDYSAKITVTAEAPAPRWNGQARFIAVI
ncbi:SRPBCC family protein [Methylogaea oryzae]|uniref:SRPBCC family protein n=1 Tax=Methylogaea oryzae TaxID=1295382 RepID=UPI0020D02A45|nr:SRPBCC family protein [Methylogaea oryzae]